MCQRHLLTLKNQVDGQPQCGSAAPTGAYPTGTGATGTGALPPKPTYSVAPATGAGNTLAVGQYAFGIAGGILAVAML